MAILDSLNYIKVYNIAKAVVISDSRSAMNTISSTTSKEALILMIKNVLWYLGKIIYYCNSYRSYLFQEFKEQGHRHTCRRNPSWKGI